MANNGQDNLIPFNKLTVEEQRDLATKGGIASGKVRKEKATMKKTLEMMLNSRSKKDSTYMNDVTLGIIANAIDKTKGGSPEAYKTIMAVLGELEDKTAGTPDININIVDNTALEKAMYEEKEG